MNSCKKSIIAICAVTTALTVTCAFSGMPARSQSIPDSAASKQEQARRIEREIAALEAQLAKDKSNTVEVSKRLEEVEKQIVATYMEIDSTAIELEKSRKVLNGRLRSLYMDGRTDDIIQLMSSSDVSDFLARLEKMSAVVQKEADVFKALREKKAKNERYQEQLVKFKQESLRLLRSADTRMIEAQLEQKKNELATVSSEIISMQLPQTQTPAPTAFNPSRVYSAPDESGFKKTGQVISGYASWYGNEFNGRSTASGEIFDQYAFTCAHRTLPFGTWLRVMFKGRSVVVKVNDRGPFVSGRMLDLSRGAAEAIGLSGVQWVDCEILVTGGS